MGAPGLKEHTQSSQTHRTRQSTLEHQQKFSRDLAAPPPRTAHFPKDECCFAGRYRMRSRTGGGTPPVGSRG
eukprot:2314660-Prymnesium_polylepis.1